MGKRAAEEAAHAFNAEDVLPTKTWGSLWTDYFGSSKSYNRSGRGRAIARALGDKEAPFTVEHPVISALLANRLGVVAGGLAGYGLGEYVHSDPTIGKALGTTIGSFAGEIAGSNIASVFRRRQLKNLSRRLQDALDSGAALNTEQAPPSDWASDWVPTIGAGRAGHEQANLQLKQKTKNPMKS